MINYAPFFLHIQSNALKTFSHQLEDALYQRLAARSYGDIEEWQACIDALPTVENIAYQLDKDIVSITTSTVFSDAENAAFKENLMRLHPWRKGPFQLFDQTIDTEWRSDWKWQRLAPHIDDLTDKTVLDVGCGSGYHCWRMRGAGAKCVVGIDPTPKFLFQFEVFKHYLPLEPVYLLPLMSEDLPKNMQVFDTVFSMGILYHRRSPFEHLEELKSALKSGGQLVLETLVIDGDENTVLIPEGRYAQMRNVWFLPSAKALQHWLKRLGFKDIQLVNVNQTSTEEQRPTDWMTFQSLTHYLDTNDTNKTIEGLPAPKRAMITAKK